MTTEDSSPTEQLTTGRASAFKSLGFQAPTWEVVADHEIRHDFKVLELVHLNKEILSVNPLFESYDGLVVQAIAPLDGALSIEEEPCESGQNRGALNFGCESEDALEETSESVDAMAEALAEVERRLESEKQKHAEERQELEAEHARKLEEVVAQSKQESDERIRLLEQKYGAVIEDLNVQLQEGIEGVERRAVQFAVLVARKLVGTIVEINPEYVLQIIKEAVQLTGGATIKAIRVSPQDIEFLQMLSPERQFKELDGAWSFQADDTIRSGCVVETSAGQVEYDLDKAWERIKDSVVKVR